jgi:hypothetical protein
MHHLIDELICYFYSDPSPRTRIEVRLSQYLTYIWHTVLYSRSYRHYNVDYRRTGILQSIRSESKQGALGKRAISAQEAEKTTVRHHPEFHPIPDSPPYQSPPQSPIESVSHPKPKPNSRRKDIPQLRPDSELELLAIHSPPLPRLHP